MTTVASQITSLMVVYSTVYSDADQRKHHSCASLAFVWGIHRRPVNSPHKWPVTRKMFPFDDVIMCHSRGRQPPPPDPATHTHHWYHHTQTVMLLTDYLIVISWLSPYHCSALSWDYHTIPISNSIRLNCRTNMGIVYICLHFSCFINSFPPGQNDRHFADDMFKCIFLNGNILISNKISLKYVPWGLIDNMPALVQIMVWRRSGDKPLS